MAEYYKNILAHLAEFNTLSIFIRLTFAVIVGTVVGIDRGRKHRPAGIKTHVLVCMGSALVMITSQFMTVRLGSTGDIGRMGAQVVSGIGFLGAGTIMITGRNQVTGLTTAAGLWYSACMGLAIGIGFYEGAVIACLFVMIVLKVLARLENYIYGNSVIVDLYVEICDTSKISEVITYIKSNDCKITNLEVEKMKTKGLRGASILISLYLKNKSEHESIISKIGQIEGVRFIEEV